MKKSGFLKIYIIVMVFATLAGGYLVWSSKSKYESSEQAFNSAVSKVKALKNSKIYPSSNNLKEKEKKVSEYVEAVNQFKAKVLESQVSLKSDFTEQNFRKLMEEESAGIVSMAEEKKLVTAIEGISLHHEQSCSFAAVAYAEKTNNIGVCLVSTG